MRANRLFWENSKSEGGDTIEHKTVSAARYAGPTVNRPATSVHSVAATGARKPLIVKVSPSGVGSRLNLYRAVR
jgi:hypothetical protein